VPNHIRKKPSFVCKREGERPALYDERQVDNPYAGRKHYNNLIAVPYCDAGMFYEYPLRKDRSNSEAKED